MADIKKFADDFKKASNPEKVKMLERLGRQESLGPLEIRDLQNFAEKHELFKGADMPVYVQAIKGLGLKQYNSHAGEASSFFAWSILDAFEKEFKNIPKELKESLCELQMAALKMIEPYLREPAKFKIVVKGTLVRIKHPTSKFLDELIKKFPEVSGYLNYLDKEGYMPKGIALSEESQIIAVGAYPEIIDYISSPSASVKKLAEKGKAMRIKAAAKETKQKEKTERLKERSVRKNKIFLIRLGKQKLEGKITETQYRAKVAEFQANNR